MRNRIKELFNSGEIAIRIISHRDFCAAGKQTILSLSRMKVQEGIAYISDFAFAVPHGKKTCA